MKTNNNKLLALAGVALLTLLVLATTALTVVTLIPRNTASAQTVDTQQHTTQISVRGSGSISAKPDTLQMSIGVVTQDTTVQAAQTKASQVAAALQEKIKAAGVEDQDYRTAQYSIDPVMDYSSGADKGGNQLPKLTGFRVTNIFEITMHTPERAPELLDSLVSAGANTVYGVSYTFADPDGLSRQAYDKAVQDAQARATKLASLSNVKLGKIVSISDASAGTAIPAVDRGVGLGGGGGSIVPGQQSVQVDVIVTYDTTANQ